MPDFLEVARQLGAAEVLSKPISMATLLQSVAKLLRKAAEENGEIG